MNDIIGMVGGAIGSIFDNPVIQLGIKGFALYWVVLWIAAAYWAFRDLQGRTENAIAPYLGAAFIIVFTPILFPLAVFTYRIVRPQDRIGEVYERNLAEEAMLAEIEAIPHCSSCDRRVDPAWIICPTCRTRLNRVCPNCTRLVGLDWSLCAWCGREFERHEALPAGAPRVTRPEHQALPAHGSDDVRAAVRVRAPQAGVAPDPLGER